MKQSVNAAGERKAGANEERILNAYNRGTLGSVYLLFFNTIIVCINQRIISQPLLVEFKNRRSSMDKHSRENKICAGHLVFP